MEVPGRRRQPVYARDDPGALDVLDRLGLRLRVRLSRPRKLYLDERIGVLMDDAPVVAALESEDLRCAPPPDHLISIRPHRRDGL